MYNILRQRGGSYIMTKYYNTLEYKKALHLVGKDPMEAKKRYEDYIEKYPTDYSAYLIYAAVLIKLKATVMAEKVLDYVEAEYQNDAEFCYQKDKVEYIDSRLVLNRLKILLYEERYDEFYDLYLDNKEKIDPQEVEVALFYVKKQLGMLKKEDRSSYRYIFRQIIDYSEKDFKNCVKYHLIDDTETNINDKSMFVSGFELDKVLAEVKKYIPSENCIYSGFYQDAYIFKYDYCGKDNNKAVDYFKVVCLHNTSDIISMCPSLRCENLPSVDLNYVKDEKPKQKTLSQIEKFNRRYRSER